MNFISRFGARFRKRRHGGSSPFSAGARASSVGGGAVGSVGSVGSGGAEFDWFNDQNTAGNGDGGHGKDDHVVTQRNQGNGTGGVVLNYRKVPSRMEEVIKANSSGGGAPAGPTGDNPLSRRATERKGKNKEGVVAKEEDAYSKRRERSDSAMMQGERKVENEERTRAISLTNSRRSSECPVESGRHRGRSDAGRRTGSARESFEPAKISDTAKESRVSRMDEEPIPRSTDAAGSSSRTRKKRRDFFGRDQKSSRKEKSGRRERNTHRHRKDKGGDGKNGEKSSGETKSTPATSPKKRSRRPSMETAERPTSEISAPRESFRQQQQQQQAQQTRQTQDGMIVPTADRVTAEPVISRKRAQPVSEGASSTVNGTTAQPVAPRRRIELIPEGSSTEYLRRDREPVEEISPVSTGDPNSGPNSTSRAEKMLKPRQSALSEMVISESQMNSTQKNRESHPRRPAVAECDYMENQLTTASEASQPQYAQHSAGISQTLQTSQASQTLQVPQTLQISQIPFVPQIPQVPRGPQIPQAPQISQMPGDSPASRISSAPLVSQAPQVSQIRQVPPILDPDGQVQALNQPKVASARQTAGAPCVISGSQGADLLQVTDLPQVIDLPQVADALLTTPERPGLRMEPPKRRLNVSPEFASSDVGGEIKRTDKKAVIRSQTSFRRPLINETESSRFSSASKSEVERTGATVGPRFQNPRNRPIISESTPYVNQNASLSSAGIERVEREYDLEWAKRRAQLELALDRRMDRLEFGSRNLLGAALPKRTRRVNAEQYQYQIRQEVMETVRYAYEKKMREQAKLSGRGIRHIVGKFREHITNAIVVQHCAYSLAELSEDDPSAGYLMGQHGVIEFALMAISMPQLENSNPGVVEKCIHLLHNLIRGIPENQSILDQYSGVERLVEIAGKENFQNRPEIAIYALEVLVLLHSDQEGSSRTPLRHNRQAEIFPAIVKAMKLHATDVRVQRLGVASLRVLLARARAVTPPVTELRNIAEAATRAVQMGRDSLLLENALNLFCEVDSVGESAIELDASSFFKAFRSVLTEEVSKIHSGRASLRLTFIERAIDTAVNATWQSMSGKERAVKAGGVEISLQILKSFPAYLNVMGKATNFLRQLLEVSDGRNRCNEAGGQIILLDACTKVCELEPSREQSQYATSRVTRGYTA